MSPPPKTPEGWQLLTTTPNMPLARVMSSLLEEHGVPCRIDTGPSLLGDAQPCGVMVETGLLQKARELLMQPAFTDAELDFLATGHLSCDDAAE